MTPHDRAKQLLESYDIDDPQAATQIVIDIAAAIAEARQEAFTSAAEILEIHLERSIVSATRLILAKAMDDICNAAKAEAAP